MSQPLAAPEPFWARTSLDQMTQAQWESLCDGCGKCCLTKYEDEESDTIHYTDVACLLLDHDTCQCTDYANRSLRVPDCIRLSAANLVKPAWLPETCAYRRLAEGRPLPDWHPLVCGDPDAVHRLGHSVRRRVRCETEIHDPLLHLIDWIR